MLRRQVKLPSGSEGWIVDHIFGIRISSVGDIDSAVCKGEPPGPFLVLSFCIMHSVDGLRLALMAGG